MKDKWMPLRKWLEAVDLPDNTYLRIPLGRPGKIEIINSKDEEE